MHASDEQPDGASSAGSEHPSLAFSIVRDDAAFRLQRRIGLIPSEGLGVVRRALFLAAICWLPIALWAVATGRASLTHGEDSLASHFGIHVRCLVAIPLLIIAEHAAQRSFRPFLRYFLETGLVLPADMPKFDEAIARVVRLKRRVLPWVLILGCVVAWASAGVLLSPKEDVGWVSTSDRIPFAGWWFILVVRPIFTAIVLAWIWRACIVFILMLNLARLPLSLVPTHPDRAGGLAFVERIAFMFSPVAFAVSAVVAAAFAHDVVYHGVDPMTMKGLLFGAAALVSIVLLLPFAPLMLTLTRLKRRATLEYGSLVGRHGRLVHRRWITGEDIGSPEILDAPDLGPVADVHSIYEAVRRIKPFPFTKLGLLAIVAPASAPMLFIAVMQFPLPAVIGKIVKALL
ncbi:hypothetical protein AWB77_04425 [Caballeronia fortuita]|uniref:Uncharacterized protein n=1 Tax=Caballeronia fortuita TaxID=1777138 RepID=A0A158CQK9_9BURK|nr:hypothetical protein [Caballeronia fortuita]SAK84654.1 hypothetical protein AWB77_04425 [Caballeronia fortuita]